MSRNIKKDHRPGIRIPTAKPSIRHKSIKDYKRQKKETTWTCSCNSINDIDMYSCRMCGKTITSQLVRSEVPLSKIMLFDNEQEWSDDEPWRKW